MDPVYCSWLIVGAGPAGLACAQALRAVMPDESVLVIDSGRRVRARDHASASDIAAGVGGAGIFSDGKFSFFPAGTAVWRLPQHLLAPAYNDVAKVLVHTAAVGSSSVVVPAAPSEEEVRDYFFDLVTGAWVLKRYPTFYLGLEERKQLTERLADGLDILTQHTLIELTPNGAIVRSNSSHSNGTPFEIRPRHIVFAGGRFFPLLAKQLGLRMRFRRYEFGFRIEGPADNPVFVGTPEYCDVLDPKFRYQSPIADVEFRTFCWCRHGETVASTTSTCDHQLLCTVSGRSDCAPTNRSNFGFLVRITSPEQISHNEFRTYLTSQWFTMPITMRHQMLRQRVMPTIDSMLEAAISALIGKFPALDVPDVHIIGPSIEGVGEYPDISDDFGVEFAASPMFHDNSSNNDSSELLTQGPRYDMYAVGDTGGIYRGIVPCLVAGYALPRLVAQKTRSRIVFCTSNAGKAREVRQILGPIRVHTCTLTESQGSLEHVAAEKCTQAERILSHSPELGDQVLVEDTALEFEALSGMPGPYVKDFWERIGSTGLARVLNSFSSRRATARCIFALSATSNSSESDQTRYFEGRIEGTIALVPRGTNGFSWDDVFVPDGQPDGSSLTFAEMPPHLKNKFSHRQRALRKMAHAIY